MKKLLLSVVCLFTVIIALGQGVSRQMVAVEDGTGTWCQYCPGAAMGCDDLLSHGCNVAVIANHNGDIYANTYSNGRNTMWGITPSGAFPSVSFDGVQGLVGGNHTTSMYPSYLPKYNQTISIPSPVSMTMAVTNTGLNYTAVMTVTKEATINSTSNILYFFVTQSHVNVNWQGQTHLEHINRLMAPDVNGTPIDFTSGDVQTVTLNFTMNSAWPLIDCEFIAMLQDKDAGQGNIPGTAPYPLKKYAVYQCIKRGTIDLTPDFTAGNTQIQKGGTVDFTDQTIGGYIGVPVTYQWLFPGGVPDTSSQKNPSIVYPTSGFYDVTLIVNKGGQIDTVTKPNFISVAFGVGIENIKNDVNIYPNPNTGIFNVELSGLFNIKVSDIKGEVLYEKNNCFNKEQIDIGLKSGAYLVNIQTSTGTFTKKIVVK